MTGMAAKMLSNLNHFGLIEKAGKGDLRVTDLAVEALYGHPESKRRAAIREAAFSPELFGAIRDRHPDGFVSEHALRNLLKRDGFAEIAINPAVNSYTSTYSYLRERDAIESHGVEPGTGDDSVVAERDDLDNRGLTPPTTSNEVRGQAPTRSPPARTERESLMEGERILTTGLLSKSASFRLIVSGRIGEKEIDILIRKLQLDKEILAEQDDENDPRDHDLMRDQLMEERGLAEWNDLGK